MTKRTKRYLLRKNKGIVWQKHAGMEVLMKFGNIKVKLSNGPLVYICQDEPVNLGNGEYMYTVKLADKTE